MEQRQHELPSVEISQQSAEKSRADRLFARIKPFFLKIPGMIQRPGNIDSGIDHRVTEGSRGVEIVKVAHNADNLLLIEKAHKSDIDEIEIDVRAMREPYFWSESKLSIRHGQLPVPFRRYPTPEELIQQIDPDKKIVLDLKFLNHPFDKTGRRILEDVDSLLLALHEQGRTNLAVTGGSERIMDTLSNLFPDLEVRHTIWTERGFRRTMAKGDKVKAVSIRAPLLVELGMEPFEGKKVYVFGVNDENEKEILKMNVSGIMSDDYRIEEVPNKKV